ncbi:uncharacterized protein DUF3152 [Thermomonospora umbrina]|uniref:Uncharacterized protein DUF3152 n=2 Tax=Thermomonospora umbrina TaxID=111806 RepID=A0A3D9SV77_9ACTN|nr:uncharacterized protein DUF3152 [Thermomonospora umbrina]
MKAAGAALVAAVGAGAAVWVAVPSDDAAGTSSGVGAGAASGMPAVRDRPRASQQPQWRGPVVNGRRQPPRVQVPQSAGGRYAVVPGTAYAPRGHRGAVVRYMVDVERGLPFRGTEFAAEVHRILNDRRGWGRGRAMRFVRVSRGPAQLRVSLSSPTMVDRMCAPLVTHGELSCGRSGRAVLNARRWGIGAASYGRDLATYREYLVNHEVGHLLGHQHQQCPGPGRPAPVMVQQTKSLYGCRANAWPYPKG